MADEKVVVSGYVPVELRDRLDELLMEDEKRSSAVAKAIETEVRMREHAMEKMESSNSKESTATEEEVSHETAE